MNSLISIVVPVYNAEPFLSECIESILKQTYTNFELLLINDGSLDNSASICMQYCNCDSRIRYFEKPNEGVSATRNIGLKHASGQYVTFIDSDDIVKSDYLQSLIDNSNSDLVVSGFVSLHNNQTIREVKFPNSTIDLSNYNPTLDKVLTFGTPWAKLFKLEILRKYNIQFNPKLSLHEDHLFYFEYIKHIHNITTTDKVQYVYINRSNGQSLSRDLKQNSQNKFLAYDLLNSALETILTNNKIQDSTIPQTLNFIIRIFISYINLAICEKKDIHINKQQKDTIRKYYKPISTIGKIQKFCILNLPFSFYKKLITYRQ